VSERRPPWCKEINCPNWPGYDFCYLKQYVLDGWQFQPSRQREYTRIQEKATQNPQEVIEECRKAVMKI